jgi:hypothetical protein
MTVSSTFIEHCPTQKRFALNLLNLQCAFGAAFPPALALILIAGDAPYMWRFVVGSLSVMCLAIGLVRLGMLESPIFYYSAGRTDEAIAVLKQVLLTQIATINGAAEPNLDITVMQPLISVNKNPSLGKEAESMTVKRQLTRLLSPMFKRVFLLQISIWFLISLTSAGIGMFMPIFITRAGGSSSDSDSSVYTSMLLINLGGIPSTLFTTWLMSTWLKRRWSLVLAFVSTAFFLAALLWGSFSYYFVSSK